MLKFTVEFEGKVQFSRAFSRVDFHLEDMRPTWPVVQRALNEIEERQFKSEGARGASGKWKPLTRDYAKYKVQKYGSLPILQREQRLYKAMTGKTGDTLIVSEKDEFGYGTTLDYQPFVNKERPIVSLADNEKNFLQKEIQKDLLKRMKEDRAITQILEVQ
jgi:phage gpG-like protein